jgi:membrane-bound lytic murein transglycosylase A
MAFADLPGWAQDDHAEALRAFQKSSERLAASLDPSDTSASATVLRAACDAALRLRSERSPSVARRFFERFFRPHRIEGAASPGLVTGYYEPVISGSRTPTPLYRVALRRRPSNLVNLVDEADRATPVGGLTHARRTAEGLRPYATRAEIEQGVLSGQGLEFVYIADPVDKFFLQVQGSGLVRLQDGSRIRLTYDGKNGHPYTSIGRYLIEAGSIPAEKMTLQALGTWLRSNLSHAQQIMNRNLSYVFFREMDASQAKAPLGVGDVPLTSGRSLAVDPVFHGLGLPVFVTVDGLRDGRRRQFRRLMIAQDVGSAIKGPERGDIFFGTGDGAGRRAGRVKQSARFVVLLPDKLETERGR